MNRKAMFYILFSTILFTVSLFLSGNGCKSERTEMLKYTTIPDNEFEPAEWGKLYPLEYESWLKTREPRAAGKSRYKRGWDTDNIVYDKLSEFPFIALLFNGWGFGVEYNEPRGHYNMMIDQTEIDRSRTAAGGVCLNCKSPYMNQLVNKFGNKIFGMPYMEAVRKIPEKHRELGATCIDCHDNKTMDLKVTRWTMEEGLKRLNKNKLNLQERRITVCAQCHVTYDVPKGENMESLSVVSPWDGSRWGDISIENIISVIKRNPSYREWKQRVTGFKLAFIRHPEFEFFTLRSLHYEAGLACADCHMPDKKIGNTKISDHNIMSPLKNDLIACSECHTQSTDELRSRVMKIQDRTVSMLIQAGYATAVTAKLFEIVHNHKSEGISINASLYNRAKKGYIEAFYRVVFIGAENSVGFHNPQEAERILRDAKAFANRSERLLRRGLSQKGVSIPKFISLELSKYINGRGTKGLKFIPAQEFKDPFGTQDRFLPKSFKGL